MNRTAVYERLAKWYLGGGLIGLFVVGLYLAFPAEPADAYDTPLAKVHAYQLGCVASAGGISLKKSTDLQNYSHLTVWNNSATPVYIGGSDITSTLGLPICTDTAACPAASISMDAAGAYCLSSSGTKTVVVLAGSL